MATIKLLNYEEASPEAQAVFDDIKATRNVPDVNNFAIFGKHSPISRKTWNALGKMSRKSWATARLTVGQKRWFTSPFRLWTIAIIACIHTQRRQNRKVWPMDNIKNWWRLLRWQVRQMRTQMAWKYPLTRSFWSRDGIFSVSHRVHCFKINCAC